MCCILEIFVVTGSYDNKKYLTDTYLINFHIDSLDLTKLIDSSRITKRDGVGSKMVSINPRQGTPTKRAPAESGWYYVPGGSNTQSGPSATASSGGNAVASGSAINWWSPVESGSATSSGSGSGSTSSGSSGSDSSNSGSTSGGYYTTVSQAVHSLLSNVNPQVLGMAQVYSVGFWGYCRGYVIQDDSKKTKKFDNSNVNYTWCSEPKVSFFFNPVEIFKKEMNNTLYGIQVDSQAAGIGQLSYTQKSELKVLIDHLDIDELNLPGNINGKLQQLHNLTNASFGLLMAVAVLSFVSVLIQMLAFCFSPEKCCLSFLNFLFECIIGLIAFVGAVVVTATYSYVKAQVNGNLDTFGVKSFLSINFYAFVWSAVIVCILVVFFNLLGHCCGLFGTRRHYRTVRNPQPDAEQHKEETESD